MTVLSTVIFLRLRKYNFSKVLFAEAENEG